MTNTKCIRSWSTELETDPETGEMILKFSEIFLQQEDWRMGDHIDFKKVKRGV
uniref:Uncharacterized protein n=1 Tax=Curvibacter symbiont subsp. Hydra magnipapillata TaxID=667019 RepID=C9Y928_CURXX|nr:hypothetical protein Csp_A06290 [Curvibacter putative symbiont of Hydra magnipapillata]